MEKKVRALTVKGEYTGVVIRMKGTTGSALILKDWGDWHNIQLLFTGDEMCDFYKEAFVITDRDERFKKFKEYYDYYLAY